MIASLGALLLACAQQSPDPPFSLKVPEGYLAFEQPTSEEERWLSRRGDSLGAFQVRHDRLTSPGARANAVAARHRELWRTGLTGAEAEIEPWEGDWSGQPGAGTAVRFTRDTRRMAILERILVLGDHMVVATWEGPALQEDQAAEALSTFELPDAWIPAPPPEFDLYRGLGPNGGEKPFPGALRLTVDLTGLPGQRLVMVEIVWDAPDGMESGGWMLPPAAVEMELTSSETQGVRYRLRVDDQAGAGSPYGMRRPPIGEGLAALDAAWLAVPLALLDEPAGYRAPSWSLRLVYPANMLGFSRGGGAHVFNEQSGARESTFAALEAGRAWPYFVVGSFQPRRESGRTWHLRLDAKAGTPDDAVRGLAKLEAALGAWLPSAPRGSQLLSFPGIGDRSLPGLLVLDEDADWFDAPLDSERDGLSRRTWLARAVAAGTFGAGLRGYGSGAPFLEASLSEYAAWRLLERTWPEDAAALPAVWRARELELGALPLPLTMIPAEDAFGARRLQSRGPLVWLAIERKAGREALDKVLGAVLAAGVPWSTRDLESALAETTGEDWSRFFRDFVYGKLTPPAAD